MAQSGIVQIEKHEAALPACVNHETIGMGVLDVRSGLFGQFKLDDLALMQIQILAFQAYAPGIDVVAACAAKNLSPAVQANVHFFATTLVSAMFGWILGWDGRRALPAPVAEGVFCNEMMS